MRLGAMAAAARATPVLPTLRKPQLSTPRSSRVLSTRCQGLKALPTQRTARHERAAAGVAVAEVAAIATSRKRVKSVPKDTVKRMLTTCLPPAPEKLAATRLCLKKAHLALKAAKVANVNAAAVVAAAIAASAVLKMPRPPLKLRLTT